MGGKVIERSLRLLRSCCDRLVIRCAAVAVLVSLTLVVVAAPAMLGPVISFGAAGVGAAFAIFLLLSLADRDRQIERIILQASMLARHDVQMAVAARARPRLHVVETLLTEASALIASMEHRFLFRHPVSGLQTREPLFRLIADALAEDSPGVLGIVHLPDIDRLDAVDDDLKEHILVTLAGRITRMLGAGIMVAQVDRARLAIWLADEADDDTARNKLEAIGYALSDAVCFAGKEILPDIRISIARAAPNTDTPAALLARAARLPSDPASFQDTGDPSAVDPLMAAQARYALEQDLRRAIGRSELELAFQPLVDAGTRRVTGAEALLRWLHPVKGYIPPSHFIPIMEAAGLADEIGLWALNAACREADGWKRSGLGPLRVAVNVSGRQLDRGDLVLLVERALARHSLTSDMLEIELTETITAGDPARVSGLFAELHKLGISIAIDDFGTGYSSLSTLRSLRFDKLKIDREFVSAVHQRPESQAICRSILALGQGLGIRVLAEGIETAAEFAWLRTAGYRHFQGFYFAKPLSPSEFRDFAGDPDRLTPLLLPSPLLQPESLPV